MLEHVFSRGITHFDVAPVYGLGRAEVILGRFLREKRNRVTIATKFGLAPPRGLGRNHFAVSLAKRMLRRFPGVLDRLKGYAASHVVEGQFSPGAAVASLQGSLRAMNIDHLDLLLLHEATAEEATHSELVDALEREVKKGTIRALGIASAYERIARRTDSLPAAYRVLQFENHIAQANIRALGPSDRALITHSAFAASQRLARAIRTDAVRSKVFSERIGLDLHDPEVRSTLLLRYALDTNPAGAVLFSSVTPAHVDHNVRSANLRSLSPPQLAALEELVDPSLPASADGATPPRAG